MPISIPKFFQRAFAQNGGKQDVPITGDTSGGRASYDVGFPPITRTNIVAGGIPPFGTDFNGVLYDVSHAIQYVQSGVSFPFNQDFATEIGGYEIGAIVSDESDKSLLWINGIALNTSFPTGWMQFSLKPATETVLGISRVATQAETTLGVVDNAFVTPKKFIDSFKGSAVSLLSAGYQKLPSGLIFQWGSGTSSGTLSGNGAVTFPIAFPNACLRAFATQIGSESGWSPTTSKATANATFTIYSQAGIISGRQFEYFAIGY